jgi:transcription-repair coupling factor (superfamily II helicase)
LEIHIPENYIENIAERIRLYRDLDNIKTNEELEIFAAQLTDRFGPLPVATEELLKVVKLRWLAIELGFEKLILKNQKIVLHFITDQQSLYYSTPVFSNILTFVQKNPSIFRMKEGKDKLTLSIDGINDISQAAALLQRMKPNAE